MSKAQEQSPWLSSKWWIIGNVIALPLAGFSIFAIAGFSAWGASFNGFDFQLWATFLPAVMVAGGLCGAVLGLLQGVALRSERVRISHWVIATSLGMAFDAVLAYIGWQLFALAESNTLPAGLEQLAYIAFAVLAAFHGCSLAYVQWLVFRRKGYSYLAAWPWIAGVSWSILTPFLYAFTVDFWTSSGTVMLGEYGAVYIPFLLFSLPYIALTTMLWRRKVE